MGEKWIRHPPLYSLTDALRSVVEKHCICILPCTAITKYSNTDFYRKILYIACYKASQSFPSKKIWYMGQDSETVLSPLTESYCHFT